MKSLYHVIRILIVFISCGLSAQRNQFEDAPIPQILTYLQPLIVSKSAEAIADSLTNLSIQKIVALIPEIAKQLDYQSALDLLFAIMMQHAHDTVYQKRILETLRDIPKPAEDKPLLLTIIMGNYAAMAPVLVAWIEMHKKQALPLPDHIQNTIVESFLYTIDHDLRTQFEQLRALKLLDPALATQLLWHVVMQDKNPVFVSFLVQTGAQVDTVYNMKYTPLMIATMHNNSQMVQELLNAGADIQMVIDDGIGSALQIAIDKKHTSIEMLLRNFLEQKKELK
jgi:hypothetical protein